MVLTGVVVGVGVAMVMAETAGWRFSGTVAEVVVEALVVGWERSWAAWYSKNGTAGSKNGTAG